MNKLKGRKLELKVNISFPRVDLSRPIRFDDKTYDVDVRRFLTDDSCVISDFVAECSKCKVWRIKKQYWDIMQFAFSSVCKNIKYTGDFIDGVKKGNYQLPEVTLERGLGDCEDMAMLLASIAMCAGVPYYRLKIAMGKVSKDKVAPTGGHAWVMYLNDDNQWEFWEATAKKFGYKGVAHDLLGHSWYHSIYNTFNLKKSFKQDKIEEESRYLI